MDRTLIVLKSGIITVGYKENGIWFDENGMAFPMDDKPVSYDPSGLDAHLMHMKPLKGGYRAHRKNVEEVNKRNDW